MRMGRCRAIIPRMPFPSAGSGLLLGSLLHQRTLLYALCLGVAAGVVSGCAHASVVAEMERNLEPGGRFSILLPADWVVDSASGEFQFYATRRSRNAASVPDAWLGLTGMPPPCDRTMVDDPVAWHADLLCWREESVELSRAEMEVEGRRALCADCASTSPGRARVATDHDRSGEVRHRLAVDVWCG